MPQVTQVGSFIQKIHLNLEIGKRINKSPGNSKKLRLNKTLSARNLIKFGIGMKVMNKLIIKFVALVGCVFKCIISLLVLLISVLSILNLN